MSKFILTGSVTISVYTEVEAETFEEAVSIAEERGIEAYKFGDDSQSSESWIHSEYDGEVQKIEEA